jgi:hypothetical protein
MKSTDSASQRPFPMVVTFVTSLPTLVALLGCTGMPAAADSSRATQTTQIIIKFRDPTLDPTQQGYLKELSRDIGVTLVFVRPMSGGAYVLGVEGAVDAEHFQRVVKALAKRAEVEYAESDRRMHRMPHD